MCFYDNDNISIIHGNYTFDRYHLEALVLLYQKNKKIFFDKTVPDVYKKICKINDNEIIFDFKKITKHEILENFWTKDVCHLAFKIISILDKTKSSLAEYYFLLPQFCVCEKISHFNKEEKIASTVKTLIEKSSKINFNDKNDGVEIIYPHGRVRVIPKPDLGFKIISESEKYEISEELCNKVMDIIK